MKNFYRFLGTPNGERPKAISNLVLGEIYQAETRDDNIVLKEENFFDLEFPDYIFEKVNPRTGIINNQIPIIGERFNFFKITKDSGSKIQIKDMSTTSIKSVFRINDYLLGVASKSTVYTMINKAALDSNKIKILIGKEKPIIGKRYFTTKIVNSTKQIFKGKYCLTKKIVLVQKISSDLLRLEANDGTIYFLILE